MVDEKVSYKQHVHFIENWSQIPINFSRTFQVLLQGSYIGLWLFQLYFLLYICQQYFILLIIII